MISGKILRDAIISGANNINNQRSRVDELNVFPVPDGDTGTNMGMTVGAAVRELQAMDDSCTVGEAAKTAASAMLRGARGNSGVITSLLFRGFSKALEGKKEADVADIVAALQKGVEGAYKAVMKPTEGTILTVSRLAAKRAVEAAAEGEGLEGVLEAAIAEGHIALEQTIDMNPVLKKAGVVDAGGKGFLLILEGMLAELRGEPMPEMAESAAPAAKADFAALSADEITFAFDTVFIVRKTVSCSLEPFREFLNGIGDSLVIGEDDEAFKVHVHTNTPGEALTEAQKYGTLELAKIENMRTQAEDLAAGRHVQSTDDLEGEDDHDHHPAPAAPAEPEKDYGFVAVCAGEGLAALFRDLGCDGVVSGGQTMNPSTQSILEVVEKVNARTVFILPNNGNIIMAAQQCAHLTEKEIIVIPSKTVPQGITAMMNADFECGDPQEMAQAMTASLATASTAQITDAARDSDFDGFAIHQGDYLALRDGKLFGTDPDENALLRSLAESAAQSDPSFLSLYYGEDVTEEQGQKAEAIFAAACPNAEVSLLPGGQPVYYYMISVE